MSLCTTFRPGKPPPCPSADPDADFGVNFGGQPPGPRTLGDPTRPPSRSAKIELLRVDVCAHTGHDTGVYLSLSDTQVRDTVSRSFVNDLAEVEVISVLGNRGVSSLVVTRATVVNLRE